MTTDLRTIRMNHCQRKLADRINDRLARAHRNFEYAAAYSTQLKSVPGTYDLPGLSQLDTQIIVPIAYHLSITSGVSKVIADSDTWTMPMMIQLHEHIDAIIENMTNFQIILDEMNQALHEYTGEPWYSWAKYALYKTEHWGHSIEPFIQKALYLLDEMLGPEKLDQMSI